MSAPAQLSGYECGEKYENGVDDLSKPSGRKLRVCEFEACRRGRPGRRAAHAGTIWGLVATDFNLTIGAHRMPIDPNLYVQPHIFLLDTETHCRTGLAAVILCN